jgi:hypothetical protein
VHGGGTEIAQRAEVHETRNVGKENPDASCIYPSVKGVKEYLESFPFFLLRKNEEKVLKMIFEGCKKGTDGNHTAF